MDRVQGALRKYTCFKDRHCTDVVDAYIHVRVNILPHVCSLYNDIGKGRQVQSNTIGGKPHLFEIVSQC